MLSIQFWALFPQSICKLLSDCKPCNLIFYILWSVYLFCFLVTEKAEKEKRHQCGFCRAPSSQTAENVLSTVYVTATRVKLTGCCTSAVIYSSSVSWRGNEQGKSRPGRMWVFLETECFLFHQALSLFPCSAVWEHRNFKSSQRCTLLVQTSTISCLYTFPVTVEWHTLGFRELDMFSLSALSITRKVSFSCL